MIINKKEKGFTLVELLVVIAIIGILAGALLIVINPQSMIKKGRDAKRMAEVESLAKAINLAITDNEILLISTSSCATCNSIDGTRVVTGAGYVTFTVPAGKTGLSKFIATLPIDPINSSQTVGETTVVYQYRYASDGENFEIDTVLEHTDNAVKMSSDGGNNTGTYEFGTSLTLLP